MTLRPPILTGEQVRAIRKELGLTQEQLASKLGYTGTDRRQLISKIETGTTRIDYLRGCLLLAMQGGFKAPLQPEAPKRPKSITERQIEALWVARETGNALNLMSRRHGGQRRTLYALRNIGMLNGSFTITETGLAFLAKEEGRRKKPLDPLHRQKYNQLMGKK